MRPYLTILLAALASFCLLSCSPEATVPFHQPYQLDRSASSIWGVMRRHLALPDASHIPAVRHQIAWYQAHREGLMQDMAHSGPYLYYVLSQTQIQDLPSELALIPFVESGYNPFAYSWAGATGLWQMMPGTASGFGIPINWWYDGRRDVMVSTKAALAYLTYLHRFFDDRWLLAIAAYDTGEGRVKRSLARSRQMAIDANVWKLKLPSETRHYITKVMALQAIIKDPSKYGFVLPDIPNVPYVAQITLHQQMSLRHVAQLAHLDIASVRHLNPGYRRWSTEPHTQRTLLIPASHLTLFEHNLKHHPWHAAHTTKHGHHYTVVSGDSLSTIAARFRTRSATIRQANHLTSDRIRVGQSLVIPTRLHTFLSRQLGIKQRLLIAADHLPGPRQVIHTVQKGQKLWAIAKRYRVKPSQMRFWNQLRGHAVLQPGQQLVIWKAKRPKHKRVVVVRQGQTLSHIALQAHMSVSDLMKLNHLHHARIRIGQKLIIHP